MANSLKRTISAAFRRRIRPRFAIEEAIEPSPGSNGAAMMELLDAEGGELSARWRLINFRLSGFLNFFRTGSSSRTKLRRIYIESIPSSPVSIRVRVNAAPRRSALKQTFFRHF